MLFLFKIQYRASAEQGLNVGYQEPIIPVNFGEIVTCMYWGQVNSQISYKKHDVYKNAARRRQQC